MTPESERRIVSPGYRRALTTCLVSVGAVWVLTACGTASSATGPTPSQTASASASAKPSALPTGSVVDIQNEPNTVPGYVGAFKDMSGASCTAVAGGVSVSGKLTNSTSTPQDYRVYVSVFQGSTTVAIQQMNANHVGANASAQFSGLIKVGTHNPTCGYRVERNPSA